jgi:hypothetical protein
MAFDELIAAGGKMALQYVFQELTARRTEDDRRSGGVFSTPPQADRVPIESTGCPVCRLHREAAEARGLLEGLSLKTQNGERIPPGLGGTVPIARDCYQKADAYLRSVAIAAPQLQADCVELARAATSLHQQLSQQIAPDMLDSIVIKARRFWLESYELAYRFYTLPGGGR